MMYRMDLGAGKQLGVHEGDDGGLVPTRMTGVEMRRAG